MGEDEIRGVVSLHHHLEEVIDSIKEKIVDLEERIGDRFASAELALTVAKAETSKEFAVHRNWVEAEFHKTNKLRDEVIADRGQYVLKGIQTSFEKETGAKFAHLAESIDALRKDINLQFLTLEKKVTVIETRAAMWAMIAGPVVAVIASLVVQWIGGAR